MEIVIQYKSLEFMGYPDYKVGSDGSVWTKRGSSLLGYNSKWKEMKPTNDGGRMILNLNNGRKVKTYTVSRLVLFAFVGPCPDGMQCCHWDGNHQNNNLSNLRWDTQYGNEQDKKRHGTGNVGIRNRSAKLTEQEVIDIRKLYKTGKYSMSKLARMFRITLGTIHPIIHYKTWKHVKELECLEAGN